MARAHSGARASVTASDQLPAGWSVEPRGHRLVLTWTSLRPVPPGDSPVEFRLGTNVLGTPRPHHDGTTFSLRLTSALPGTLSDLHVTRAGIPLDRAGRPTTPTGRVSVGGASPTVPAPATRTVTAADPGAPGPYATRRLDYDLGTTMLTGLPEPVEVVGAVVSPVEAPGARPLVLFLHGRHSTCYRRGPDGRSSGDWPCPPGWKPIPSYLGYLDAQQLLASQGYVTVSISANGINGQDWAAADYGTGARSELVRYHLALWSRWAKSGGGPFGRQFVGHVELGDVLLVGHSRGGEGVNRAAVDTTGTDPWQIAGQVLIGPTDFGRQTAVGIDTLVLLPYCDGDVFDLQGQQFVDEARDLTSGTGPDPALRSAVLVMGANHNFFNSQWTPGVSAAPSWDDWWDRQDPVCGSRAPTRLSADAQRNVGAVYVATAAAAFVQHSSTALRMVDGSPLRPASLGDATTYTSALGARRTPVYLPGQTTAAPFAAGLAARVCQGFSSATQQLPYCFPRQRYGVPPHFLPMYDAPGAPAPDALRVTWQSADGRAVVPLSKPVGLSEATDLELRVAAPYGRPPSTFRLVAVTTDGRHVDLGRRTVAPLPGTRWVSKTWAQSVRFTLPPSLLDTSLRALRISAVSDAGSVLVLDAHTYREGASAASVPRLPYVDVVNRQVREGDNGTRTELLTISVTGTVGDGAALWVAPGYDQSVARRDRYDGYLVTLVPGQTTVKVPLTVEGDTRDDYDLAKQVVVKAVRGVVARTYVGALLVKDDDPAARLRVADYSVTAVEGTPLTWSFSLSAPSDKYLSFLVEAAPPDSGTELTLADLGVRYRERHGLPTGDSTRPLSVGHPLHMYVQFRQGSASTARIRLPVREDGLREGPEYVRFVWDEGAPEISLRKDLTGTVTDA